MIKHGVPQGSVLCPILFLLYINDLPAVINKKAIPVLFADDTSILCTHRNFMEFQVNIDTGLGNVNKWFKKTFIKHRKKTTSYTLRRRTANSMT
jgi:hypothetical protein